MFKYDYAVGKVMWVGWRFYAYRKDTSEVVACGEILDTVEQAQADAVLHMLSNRVED